MLRIVLSNSFEVLRDALLARLDDAPASPFTADQVIVPSAATRRRVELAIADRHGICANVEFSFLAQWLWRQIGRIVPVAEISPFAPDVLTWRVYEILGDIAFLREYPPLARYLDGSDARKRFDLAARVAALVENYITYRQDWLRAWGDGKNVDLATAPPAMQEHERWQAALWRRVAAAVGAGRRHPAELFLLALAAGDVKDTAALPARAQIFCVPAMPPLYLDLLRGLSRFVDIDVYALDPSEEYWFDVVDARRLTWLAAHSKALHRETGNRLLAAWGTQTRQFLDLLLAGDPGTSVEASAFVAAGSTSLLAQVQDAILALRDPAPGSIALDVEDRSIEIHVCHSRTRELEVLHDQLLALFAGPDPPQPSDILVVTPDIEATAPVIDAVFGNAPKARHIPFMISGRPRTRENAAARALLALLTLGASRYRASAIIDVLQMPMVARRFGVDAAMLLLVHRWMREAGVRWGLDAAHRESFGVPPEARYTLDDGVDRLLLGYALPADAAQPFDGRLPAGDPEGGDAAALGAFARYAQALRELRAALASPKTPGRWHETLREVVAAFLEPGDDDVEDARELDAAVAALRDRMVEGSADEAMPLSVVDAALTAILDDPTHGGVPTGVVTFASMASLRNLPFRVVCAIGLDDGAFPVIAPSAEFDLMAHVPRRGDRQRRDADRNVFLDLLLAARERLYVSYVGRSVRDNTPLPPSVLVAELLDYLVVALAATTGEARAGLVVEHALQPFSAAAFVTGSDLRRRSFDADYCEALRASLRSPMDEPRRRAATAAAAISRPPAEGDDAPSDGDADDRVGDGEGEAEEALAPFFVVPLAPPEPGWRDVTLPRLQSFFRNPCRFLLTQRLRIALPWDDEPLADDEPFLPDGRARRTLSDRLLDAFLHGRPRDEIYAMARAGLEYPPGRMGDLLRERELAQIEAFAAAVARDTAEAPLPPATYGFDFTRDPEPWQLRGDLLDLRPGGLYRHRYRNTHASDYLAGWIEHLFVNAVRPAGATPQTAWHSRDGTYRLRRLVSRDDALEKLAGLGDLYAGGLRSPLRFFPNSAWALVTRNAYAARQAWNAGMFPEKDDPAHALALRGVDDPLDVDFESIAHAVFDPLLAHLDDPRLPA